MDHIKNSPNQSTSASPFAITLSEPNEINTLSDWEIDFRQIEPGEMKTTIMVRAGATATFLNISMSQAVHQTGVSPKGQLTFGIVQPTDVRVWQGHDSSTSELLSFGSSDSFDGVSGTHFCGTTISVKERDLEILADELGLNIPENLRRSTQQAVIGQHRRLQTIRQNAELLVRNCKYSMTSEIEEEIVAGLLLAVTSDKMYNDKSTALSRSRAVSKATEIMLDHSDENVSISQICAESGVSWRTLDRAFYEKFGVGPKKYYLCIRLNRVRSGLIQRAKCHSISDIANRWGFWHLGQFAKDYRSMFGELPSETSSRQI